MQAMHTMHTMHYRKLELVSVRAKYQKELLLAGDAKLYILVPNSSVQYPASIGTLVILNHSILGLYFSTCT